MDVNEQILPIVVLYKKELCDAVSINSLLDNDVDGFLKEIYVYDNTPEHYYGIENHEINYKGRNLIYIHDGNNSGVSFAYNSGLKKAKELGYKYVLLLDQDTQFPLNALSYYKTSIRDNPEVKLIVPRLITLKGEYCSPLKYALHRGFVIGELKPGIYSLKKYSPINSGMLLNVNTALSCGGYNNKVYLDFSDFQFIERLKKVSSDFYVMPLTIKQDLSNDDENQENLFTRYGIYCKCARECERKNLFDDVIYFMMVLIRGVKLSIRTKKMSFITVFYKNYLRGRK